MLFIVSWSISPDNRNAVIERFLKTGSTRGRHHEGTLACGGRFGRFWHCRSQ